MSLSFQVRDVFRVGGRTIIAIDKGGDDLRAGDRFRAANGTELTVRSVALAAPEAWEAGRRGLQVDVTKGEVPWASSSNSTGEVARS